MKGRRCKASPLLLGNRGEKRYFRSGVILFVRLVRRLRRVPLPFLFQNFILSGLMKYQII